MKRPSWEGTKAREAAEARAAVVEAGEKWIRCGRIPAWAHEGLREVARTSTIGDVNRLALTFDPPEYDEEADPDGPTFRARRHALGLTKADLEIASRLGLSPEQMAKAKAEKRGAP
jgi:hypothetical protein